jgi:WD40 repeat protein
MTGGVSYWWSPNSKTLAVRGERFLLCDAATGRIQAEIPNERSIKVEGVSFTPDSRTLVVHTDRVSLYNVDDGRLLRQFADGAEPIDYYQKIFTGEWETTFSNSETGSVTTTFREPTNEEELMELPTRYLSGRNISPDGKSMLARASAGKAQVFDLGSGELKFALEPLIAAGNKKDRPGDALGEFSPDGKYIVTAHRNRTARLWDAATGALIADLASPSGSVLGVRFSHDSRFVATTVFEDGIVRIWESASGKLRQTIGSKKDRQYFAVWNPRNNSFITKTRKWAVNIWSAETSSLVATLDDKAVGEKFDFNLTFLYSPDGKILLTQASSRKLFAHLWDAQNGALIKSLPASKSHEADYVTCIWSPTSEILVAAGVSVKLWNRRGELIRELDGNALSGASMSPDGKLLAVTDGVLKSLCSTIVGAAKTIIGMRPKRIPPTTRVWRIGADSGPAN